MYELWILLTASLVAVSCALIGSILLLRGMSLLGNAISHSVLLGIVLVYILFHQTSLHWLLAGAAFTGLLTAWLTEFTQQKTKISPDASLGLVSSWFFALAVILIAAFADHVHLDHEHVLFGEMVFIPFKTLVLWEVNFGPTAFWLALIVFLINLLVLAIGFERIKLSSFQPALASALGISVVFWHYLIVSLVSVTAVASFDVAGSVLVLAFLVVPAASAFLLAKSLKQMLWIASGFALLAVLSGFVLAIIFNSSISASMAISAGIYFAMTLIAKKFKVTSRINLAIR